MLGWSRRFLGAATVVALGMMLTACGSSTTPATAPPAGGSQAPAAPASGSAPAAGGSSAPAPQAKEKPQYGGVYRTTTSNPSIGQDPIKGTGTSFTSNFGRAYSHLLRYKMDPSIPESSFIIAPELAEKWENPTPTTWVFHLTKGVKWQNIPPVNGREFVADDVVYSVNRLASKDSAHRGYWLDVEKVEAVDKYTVKFTLKQPSAPFLAIAAFGFNKMMAKEAVEGAGGDLAKGPTIGTGAWLVDCKVNVECILSKNPDYFLKDADGNKLPYLDSQRLAVMPDVQAQFAAFRAMQLDVRSLAAEERQIVERSLKDVIIEEYRSFGAYMMHFRQDKAPWSDERVRMAVSKALNRQEMVDTMAGGRGWFQMAWANPGPDWFLPEAEIKTAWKQDIEGAKKLLAEAGFPNGLDASLWCANYGVVYVPSCELMATQLAKAGIRIKINVHDQPVYLSKVFIRDGQFDDLAYGPQGTYLEPDLWLSAYYHSQGGRNSSYTRDPALDKMIEDQRKELVPEKRKQILLDIQRYLLKKNYQLPVYSDIISTGSWPWLKNRSYSAGQDYPGTRAPEYYWIDQALKKKMGAPD